MNQPLIRQPIAIVGAACRLPGADNTQQFWDLLVHGRDAIRELPPDRLDHDLYFSPQKGVRGKTYSSIGGLIPNRPLDLDLVPLAKTAYQDFDESHWIMAEVAASAWRNASMRLGVGNQPVAQPMAPISSHGTSRNVGVYIGHSGGSRRAGEVIYSSLAGQTSEIIEQLPQLKSLNATIRERIKSELCSRMRENKAKRTAGGKPFLDASSAARLVALNLELDGPQMVIDAACASSLASLAMACLSLQAGDVDAAIVGGASYNKIDSLILFSQAQSCSASGSRPFDENADGLISSEGYIALVLKTLESAKQDNDFVWGVIRGVGMSTDGRGKSLWAPRREGQLKAVQRAYSADVDPKNVQYIEAHATSTKVGDATEIQALGDFFVPVLGTQKIPIGSVKSNIGHTLETAGLAGVLKTLLAMHHETIPPSIHFSEPSQSIPWHTIPFTVPTAPQRWSQPAGGAARCGAVNAFGIGGLNVHVVLEQGSNDRTRTSLPPANRKSSETHRASSKRNSKQPIAIIGRGLIVPGANGMLAFANLMQSNCSQMISPPANRWKSSVGLKGPTATIPTARGGYLTDYAYDWMKHRVPPKQVQNANPLQFMLLDAAGQALEDARQSGTDVDFERTSVVVGTIFGGEFGHQLQMGLRLMELRRDLQLSLLNAGIPAPQISSLLDSFEQAFLEWNPALLDETGSFTSSTLASRITKQYNLQGGALAIDTGACSSLAALYAAMNLLDSGYSDSVICAAGNRAMDLPAFETLSAKGLLADDRSPYLPGEGVAVLLLKRLSDAKSHRNKIYGVLNPMRIEKSHDRAKQQAHPMPSAIQPMIGDLQAARGLTEILHSLAAKKHNGPVTIQQMTDDYLMHSISVSNGDEPAFVPTLDSSADIANEPSNNMDNISQGRRRSNRDTVALFPGQGFHQIGMLNYCVSISQDARHTLQQADDILRSLGSVGYDEVVRRAVDGSLESSWYSQASILVADVVHWAAIREHGFEPASIVGHSLGEWAALVAAESWDLETALQFLKLRSNAVDELAIREHGLLSIPLGAERMQSLLCEFPNSLVITHCNSPKQTVIGGQLVQLAQLEKHLLKQAVVPVLLNVPAPFHTPAMAGAAHRLAQGASALKLLPPNKIFFSTVSDSYESDPRRIVRNLIHQFTTPVDFCSAIEKLHQHGGQRFIEIGPGKVLTRLCRNILENRSAECFEFREGLDSARANLATTFRESTREASTLDVFDATQKRRQRRKEQAVHSNGMGAPKSDPIRVQSSTSAAPSESSDPHVLRRTPSAETKIPALETFIKDFIVEHTGYPKEMIQLDWELEADLGIDSIKLVQLMGELRELFDLDPQVVRNAGVKTLREILVLLETAGGKREWLEDRVETVPQLAAGSSDSGSTDLGARTGRDSQMGRTALRDRLLQEGERDSQMGRTALGDRLLQEEERDTGVSRSRLETFMVDFVIEHTGYPRHMVDMSAELEADLGLDSIKLAQLMGELRSHFGFDLNNDVRKQLAKARTLNEILSTLGVEESEPIATSAGVSTIDQTQSVLQVATPEHRSPPTAWSDSYAAQVHAQLVDDLQSWKMDSHPAANRLSFGDTEKLNTFARSIGVPNESLRGLLNRHGHKSEWKELTTYLDAVPLENRSEEFAPIHTPTAGITNRYVLRAHPSAEQPQSTAVEWNGAACVLGDNAVAAKLSERLHREGVPTLCIDSHMTESESIAKLESFWNQHGSVPYLFLTNPHDQDAAGSLLDRKRLEQRHASTKALFWVCQRWYMNHLQSGSLPNASLVALTRLDGGFGFQRGGVAPESGALGGLLKAILIESWVNGHRQLPIKVIDSDSASSPDTIVERALIELANPSFDTEVGWIDGVRHVVRAVPTATIKGQFRPSRGVWICTGGGRGITAFVAEQLAKRYGLELHLLGMAPAPHIAPQHRDLDEQGRKEFKNRVMLEATDRGLNSVKAWQDMEKQLEIDATLRRMRAEGISVYYHCCDVTDRKSLDVCIAHIREHHGPIRGCLHGAGVGQDSRFERKRPDKVQQCFGAKMDGLVNLMQSTLQDPLECFIGFGSISGRFGANGHTDYSSANEVLAKYMGWYRTQRPDVRSSALHWHAWGDVGMATKPETKLALEMIEMQFMPAEEGLRHLTNEIEAGLPEPEVLITDDRYFRMFYPSETIQSGTKDESKPNEAAMPKRPLFDRIEQARIEQDGNSMRFHGHLEPTRDVFLKEHVYEGNPLLPFVIALECMAEAATAANTSPGQELFPMRFENVSILRPFRFESSQSRQFFVDCSTLPSKGSIESTRTRLTFCGPVRNRSGVVIDAAREFSSADWTHSSKQAILGWDKPNIAIAHSSSPAYPKPSQPFYVGPAFRVLKQYALKTDRIVGRILAPSLIELVGSHRTTENWVLPCAVIDACLFTSGILAWNAVHPGICLPMSIQSIQFAGRPRAGESCTVESRLVRADDQYVWFDFCVWGSDARPLMEAKCYQAAWVGNVS
jgi:acyl transferase domain-containing protein/acyl carrier protein/NAD(P)-dependent dehydrogenase (short-subunit alcohol dehydrogenase family)